MGMKSEYALLRLVSDLYDYLRYYLGLYVGNAKWCIASCKGYGARGEHGSGARGKHTDLSAEVCSPLRGL